MCIEYQIARLFAFFTGFSIQSHATEQIGVMAVIYDGDPIWSFAINDRLKVTELSG